MKEIIVKDNSMLAKAKMEDAKYVALVKIGLVAEGFAKSNLARFPRRDTGRLINSVSNTVWGDAAYIGTNVNYAVYVEWGTGPYVENGTGRKDVPWFYKSKKDGKWHASYGMKPSHFLKNAAADHKQTYWNIINDTIHEKFK